MVEILEKAINGILKMDSQEHVALMEHSGKALNLKFTDLSFELFFIFRPEKVYIYSVYTETSDAILSGTLFNFLKQLRSDEITNDLLLEGDIEFAHDVLRLLKNIDINWEEYLSVLIGDFPTNYITNFLGQCKQAIKKVSTRTLEDTVEFIQEEQRFVPTREEIEDFYQDLVDLRHDIDRLEARWNRLMDMSKHEDI